MKYLLIPLRYLSPETGTPDPLPYGATRAEHYAKNVTSILADVERGELPSWPISSFDLCANVTIVDGPDLPDHRYWKALEI